MTICKYILNLNFKLKEDLSQTKFFLINCMRFCHKQND